MSSSIPLDSLPNDIDSVYIWLKEECNLIRAGAPSASILDSIHIPCYGSSSELSHIATISIGDPMTLIISPWDKTLIPDIEKHVSESITGATVSADDDIVRVAFSPITNEQREELKKIVLQKKEQARIRIKQIREKVMKYLDSEEKAGNFSEDELRKEKEDVEKKIKESHAHVEKMIEEKQKELSG